MGGYIEVWTNTKSNYAACVFAGWRCLHFVIMLTITMLNWLSNEKVAANSALAVFAPSAPPPQPNLSNSSPYMFAKLSFSMIVICRALCSRSYRYWTLGWWFDLFHPMDWFPITTAAIEVAKAGQLLVNLDFQWFRSNALDIQILYQKWSPWAICFIRYNIWLHLLSDLQ